MKTIDSYKNLDKFKLNEICVCLNFVEVLSKNISENMLNNFIKVFNEVKRDRLDFILDFISIYKSQLFLRYILNENLHNSKVINMIIMFISNLN